MISNTVQAPPLVRYEDLAKMIDHSLVRPELTDDEVIAGCELARKYDVASVSVRSRGAPWTGMAAAMALLLLVYGCWQVFPWKIGRASCRERVF